MSTKAKIPKKKTVHKAPSVRETAPLQKRILDSLATGPKSAQALQVSTDTTLESVRDALYTMTERGVLRRNPVTFEVSK